MRINKIIITGGSGFIANYLINYFKKNILINIIVFSRKKIHCTNFSNIKYVLWDSKNIDISWVKELENTDLLINLTGKNVQCLFTKKNKEELLNSRIDAINVLSKACCMVNNSPKLWIQASGLGFYGNTKKLCNELTKKGNGFLSDLIETLENVFFNIQLNKTRKISLRLGLALHNSGGILPKLVNCTKYYLGGGIEDSNMYISYFHLFDLTKILEFLFYHEYLEGIFNVCTPYPLSNKIFMKELRYYFNKIYFLPISSFIFNFILKNIIKIDPELILNFPKVIPKKLLDEGFQFKFLNLNSILIDLYSNK